MRSFIHMPPHYLRIFRYPSIYLFTVTPGNKQQHKDVQIKAVCVGKWS